MESYGATLTPSDYNPNAITAYKIIEGDQVSYGHIKTNDLEYELDKNRQYKKAISEHNGLIVQLQESIVEWYNPNYTKEEVLLGLCELLQFTPRKEIGVRATISVDVLIELPIDEIEDFDARYYLQDNLSIDSLEGNIGINSFDVDRVDVDWN